MAASTGARWRRAAWLGVLLVIAGCHARKETYCQRQCARARTCTPQSASPQCEARCLSLFARLYEPQDIEPALRERRRQLVDCQDRCLRKPLGAPVEDPSAPSPECRAIADCDRECRTRFAGPVEDPQ